MNPLIKPPPEIEMKLPIIHSLWVGKPLTNLEKLAVQSFLDNGHEFHLYVYDDVQGIPKGVVVKDGNDIVEYKEISSGTLQDWSGLSDYFRYALLYKLGGWWVDMDTVCLKPFDFNEEIIFCKPEKPGYSFPSNLLCFPPKHWFVKRMLDICRSNIQRKNISRIGVGGTEILTEQIYKAGIENLACPHEKFFIPTSGMVDYFTKSGRDEMHISNNTYSVHISNYVSGRIGMDKNAQYDSGSLFEELKAKHKIANLPDAQRITTVDINKRRLEKKAKRAAAKARRKRRKQVWIAIAVGGSILFLISKLAK